MYVEVHILHPKTMQPTSSWAKFVTSSLEFTKIYNLVKADSSMMINVLNYDPQKNPGQKSTNDAKLFSMSREVEV